MPFKSLKQERFMNANPEILGKERLNEFNESSKGIMLPEYSHKIKELAHKHAKRKNK